MIHFEMDEVEPSDILAAVADGPEGSLKLKEVVRLINDIACEKELVALTVAEPMPRPAIRLKQMLSELYNNLIRLFRLTNHFAILCHRGNFYRGDKITEIP